MMGKGFDLNAFNMQFLTPILEVGNSPHIANSNFQPQVSFVHTSSTIQLQIHYSFHDWHTKTVGMSNTNSFVRRFSL